MIKQKVLFIDRDGVLLLEPEDQQIDSIDKINFPSNMLQSLSEISSSLDYKLVMVTNQDGLGTASFPERDFWPVHELLIRTLQSVNVEFDEINIDRSIPEENSPYRKPGTAMLRKYMSGKYDLSNSYVIGDRASDMQLAKNLSCKGILFNAFNGENKSELTPSLITSDWTEISRFLTRENRKVNLIRNTKETKISVAMDLDGNGESRISTGLSFLDHMLDQIARHSGINLEIKTAGDLNVDEHHTIEDTAIALGEAINKALAKKVGLQRYGFALPMDDCRSQVLLDFGGRSWLEWDVKFERENVGDCPTEMFFHFFKSLADSAKVNINVISRGDNEHHKIESIFKAFARALKMAITRDLNDFSIPTTKGML